MATIIDLGDPNNIHPVDKVDVGHRLSLVARHAVYGEKDLVWTGPIYDSMKVEGNTIRINFTQTGSGLIIGSSPWVPPHTMAIPTTSLVGFAIAGADRHWVGADATIDGNTVVVSSDKVASPVAVRYAWQNSPECNLFNKEGLAAAPFRTDDWPDEGESPPRTPAAPAVAPAAPTPAPAATPAPIVPPAPAPKTP
jgi:sialate O-acetylesterase